MAANKHYVVNRDPLEQTELVHLPLGAVRPRGWLKDQLRVQANGLTGHLDEFWIHDSWWKGGTGENNAGTPSKIHLAPNYLEGLVPLAYLLDDKRLIDKVAGYMEFVLASGRPDGYFGPVQGEDSDCRLLGRARVLRTLPDYYEATGDERVLSLCHDYLTRYLMTGPPEEWLGDCTFKENLVCAYWLYNQTGRPEVLDAAARIGSRPFPNGRSSPTAIAR